MQFRKCVNLLRCAVEDVQDTELSMNCFDIVHDAAAASNASPRSQLHHGHGEGRTRFCAHSKEVKAIWMDLISQQSALILEQAEAQRQRELVKAGERESSRLSSSVHRVVGGAAAFGRARDAHEAPGHGRGVFRGAAYRHEPWC